LPSPQQYIFYLPPGVAIITNLGHVLSTMGVGRHGHGGVVAPWSFGSLKIVGKTETF